jgi:hypothetical protein
MSLPDKSDWKAVISYFSKNKKDDANLRVIIKRAQAYRLNGTVDLGEGSNTSNKEITSLAKKGTKKRVKKLRSKSEKKMKK